MERPSNPFSPSHLSLRPLLIIRSRWRHLIHLPKRRRQLPRRNGCLLRFSAAHRPRRLHSPHCWSWRSRVHQPPCGHGRTGSPSLADENGPLESVLLEHWWCGWRRWTTPFPDFARDQTLNAVILARHYHSESRISLIAKEDKQ